MSANEKSEVDVVFLIRTDAPHGEEAIIVEPMTAVKIQKGTAVFLPAGWVPVKIGPAGCPAADADQVPAGGSLKQNRNLGDCGCAILLVLLFMLAVVAARICWPALFR
jgi:hypothetical protein